MNGKPDKLDEYLNAACKVHQSKKSWARKLAVTKEFFACFISAWHVARLYKLGIKYYNGQDVKQDYAQAMRLLKDAAEYGIDAARCALGLMYYEGAGVPQDREQSQYWFKQADVQEAFFFRSSMRDGVGESAWVRYWKAWFGDNNAWKVLTRDAEQGDADAQIALGVKMAYQTILSAKKGRYWLEKAAAQGEAEAQFLLGHMYWHGNGVKQDRSQALRLFKEAAAKGDELAQSFLDLGYSED